MSVTGYFERPKPAGLERLREIVGEVGGRTERTVEHGKKTLEDWQAEYRAGRVKRGGPGYVPVEKYDPVLRAHCRVAG